ncbi:MAG: hypothetical protein IJV06_06275 [Bacteroidaceae bacterium]|nr:hypothetical protein [Bacteroidaceae bacterium]
MSRKLWGYMEMGGETLVVLAAAMWITHHAMVSYLFAVGTVLFAVGRWAQGGEAILAETPVRKQLNMRRLLRQRNIGMVLLLMAAVFMFVRHTYHLGQNIYVFPSSWLVPFTCFVVIEVYTAFRIPYLLKG